MRHEHFRLRSVPKTAMNNSLFVYYHFFFIYIVIIDEQVVVYQQQQQKVLTSCIFGRNHVVLTHKCTWNVHNVDANIPPWLHVHVQT